jgi:hypothetical protein
MSDIEQLTTAIRELARERDWERFHTPKNLAMALSVEVAELVELFQWLTPKESTALVETPGVSEVAGLTRGRSGDQTACLPVALAKQSLGVSPSGWPRTSEVRHRDVTCQLRRPSSCRPVVASDAVDASLRG